VILILFSDSGQVDIHFHTETVQHCSGANPASLKNERRAESPCTDDDLLEGFDDLDVPNLDISAL